MELEENVMFEYTDWSRPVIFCALYADGFWGWSLVEIRVSDMDLPVFSIDGGLCIEEIMSPEGNMSYGERCLRHKCRD